MKIKPARLSARADQDLLEAAAYYLETGGESLAIAFSDSLEKSMVHLSRFPASGSERLAFELGLPGLRSWPMARFPYLIFYTEAEHHLDIRRVLNGKRDVPAWLAAPDGGASG